MNKRIVVSFLDFFAENPFNYTTFLVKYRHMDVGDRYPKKKVNEQHIHSPAHALADELANKLSDRRRFGFYLKMATLYDHNILRRIAGAVLEAKAKRPGALFAFLIKKENDEKKSKKEQL